MTSKHKNELNPEYSEAMVHPNIAAYLVCRAPVGIYIVKDSRIVTTNSAAQTILGYREEDMVNMSPLDLVHPDDQKTVRVSIEEMYRYCTLSNVEYRVCTKSKEVKWVQALSQLVDIASGSTYSTFIIDVTQRKRIEENLRASGQRFRDLTESTSDMIWELDTKGVYTYVNPQIETVLGYRPDEVINKISFLDFSPPEVDAKQRMEYESFVRNKAFLVNWEILNVHKNGHLVALSSNGVPIYDSSGKLIGFRGTDRDVTEQRYLRENLRFYITELTKAQENERERIARELHDETAQTLSRVCTECDIIINQKKLLPDDTNRRIRQIRGFVADILQQVRRHSLELRPALLDRVGLVPSLELLINEINRDKNIKCRLEVTGADRRTAPDTELASFRIIHEAIRNAQKHSNATEVLVKVQYLGDQLNIAVSDNGIGFKVPDALTSFARTGQLGLIGMSERVRALDGTMTIESGKGKGTQISLKISG